MDKSQSKYFNTAVRMDKALISLLEKKDFDYITIKEICEKAEVNRSTFYLHYETTRDLLQECIEYINKKCFESFDSSLEDMASKIHTCPPRDLIFITPEFLHPYLQFIKDNKTLFKTAVKQSEVMNAPGTFENMYRLIFEPILERFNFSNDEKKYIMAFYINGLIAIVMEWLKNDCKDTIEELTNIMIKCILPEELPIFE